MRVPLVVEDFRKARVPSPNRQARARVPLENYNVGDSQANTYSAALQNAAPPPPPASESFGVWRRRSAGADSSDGEADREGKRRRESDESGLGENDGCRIM